MSKLWVRSINDETSIDSRGAANDSYEGLFQSEKETAIKNNSRRKPADASTLIGGKPVGHFETYVGHVCLVF
ncbi:hypothetical protein [Bacillus pumilus]|uniref:hypothetical protein n=1 Tax=Bacillus pumilus TaxID=1408 RepID=UPI0016424DBE|nr:hypothetical protein [Bacillus pumilus]